MDLGDAHTHTPLSLSLFPPLKRSVCITLYMRTKYPSQGTIDKYTSKTNQKELSGKINSYNEPTDERTGTPSIFIS